MPIDHIEVIGMEHDDKLLHVLAYLIMVVLLYFNFKKVTFKVAIWITIVVCFVYGILVEILQPIISDKRAFDYYDILANSLGILVGVLILNVLKNKLKSDKPLLF